MCTTGDTAHIDTIFKFLPHTCQNVDACVGTTRISYRCVPCHPWCTHQTSVVVKKKKLFQFSCGCEKFHSGRYFGFLVINVCNHGEHYETPCISPFCLKLHIVEAYTECTCKVLCNLKLCIRWDWTVSFNLKHTAPGTWWMGLRGAWVC